jgi:hypothetical protein
VKDEGITIHIIYFIFKFKKHKAIVRIKCFKRRIVCIMNLNFIKNYRKLVLRRAKVLKQK